MLVASVSFWVPTPEFGDEVQHPCRFDIGRLIKTLGSVAMRCLSSLSDDEREQIRIEPALRQSITFDNDTAFAQHALLRTMRAMTT